MGRYNRIIMVRPRTNTMHPLTLKATADQDGIIKLEIPTNLAN